jgi:ketosteroid isomerase-like protein
MSRFAHVWRLRGGKIVKFQQYTDTLQATKAVSG